MSLPTSVFSEFVFSPRKNCGEYNARVLSGYKRMRDLRVVIAGLARDIADSLRPTIRWLDHVLQLFGHASAVIMENDSKDVTRLALEGWAARDPKNRHVFGDDLGKVRYGPTRDMDRMDWMSFLRNTLKQRCLEVDPQADYVIFLDLDLGGQWSVYGLANTFGHQDWDVVGSNGLKLTEDRTWIYYDVWALRWRDNDRPLWPRDIVDWKYARGDKMVLVSSCFGGMAVYRRPALEAVAYGGGDCEHVVFHRKLRENGFGRVYLNPSQIVVY